MNKGLYILLVFLALISSCTSISSKFLTKNTYSSNSKIKNVYVLVLSDKHTKECLNYYKTFLLDSLKSINIKADGAFYCCIKNKTEIYDTIKKMSPQTKDFQNLLTIVISETNIGAGTASSRDLQLDLFEVNKAEPTWHGILTASFNWFVSDEDYKAVAKKLTKTTLSELKNKGVL